MRRGYRSLFARRSTWRARRGISWSSAFRPRGRKPATAISSAAAVAARPRGVAAYAVRRFTEKPALPLAREICRVGKIFLECRDVFLARFDISRKSAALSAADARRAAANSAGSIGTRRYASALRRIYPQLENISVDYAVMEPATRPTGAAARVRDSRESRLERHRLLGRRLRIARGEARRECVRRPSSRSTRTATISGVPKKFVAAIGVRDLVLVETDDASALLARPLAGRRQNCEMARRKSAFVACCDRLRRLPRADSLHRTSRLKFGL